MQDEDGVGGCQYDHDSGVAVFNTATLANGQFGTTVGAICKKG